MQMKVIGDMVTGYVESLRTHGYFYPEGERLSTKISFQADLVH